MTHEASTQVAAFASTHGPVGLTPWPVVLAGVSLALLTVIAILAVRDARGLLQGRVLALLCISLAGLEVSGLEISGSPVGLVARILGLPNIGLLWWFCLALLKDDFRLGRWAWAGMAALTLAPALYLAEDLGIRVPVPNAVDLYGSLAPFVMVAHVAWLAFSGRAADLVEPRRRARLWLVAGLMLAAVISLASEYAGDPAQASLLRRLLAIVPAELALVVWLLRLQIERLRFDPAPVTVAAGVDPRDLALLHRLTRAVEADQVYLREGLTIEQLAVIVAAPAHQVRHLINAGLGYRNFPAFLNHYRLAHAKAALGDLGRGRETVLSIAYESGFASLATFNRVFRDAEGVAPTAYRAAALAEVARDAETAGRLQN